MQGEMHQHALACKSKRQLPLGTSSINIPSPCLFDEYTCRARLNPKGFTLLQKRPSHSGSLKQELPRDSKVTILHLGDVLEFCKHCRGGAGCNEDKLPQSGMLGTWLGHTELTMLFGVHRRMRYMSSAAQL